MGTVIIRIFLSITITLLISCGEPGGKINRAAETINKKDSAGPIPVFENFPADIYQGKIASVDTNNALVKKHWLSFLPPSTSRPSFAGHLGVVQWQHPSNSIGGLIVDLKNGAVYELPKSILGYQYKIDSRLIVVNPRGDESRCYSCKTEYWIWNDETHAFVKF